MEYMQMIRNAWKTRKVQVNWLGMEDTLVNILKDREISDASKVALAKEAIDAFTKRSYFHSDEYKQEQVY